MYGTYHHLVYAEGVKTINNALWLAMCDLPDMYTRARVRAVPEGECRHIRQITSVHVTYVM